MNQGPGLAGLEGGLDLGKARYDLSGLGRDRQRLDRAPDQKPVGLVDQGFPFLDRLAKTLGEDRPLDGGR